MDLPTNPKWRKMIQGLYNGHPIRCSKREYRNGLRTAIQIYAGGVMSGKQGECVVIALKEIQRLDQVHNFQFQ